MSFAFIIPGTLRNCESSWSTAAHLWLLACSGHVSKQFTPHSRVTFKEATKLQLHMHADDFISVISPRVLPEYEVCKDCSKDMPQPVAASHYDSVLMY